MQLPFVTQDKKHIAFVYFLIGQFVDCVTQGWTLDAAEVVFKKAQFWTKLSGINPVQVFLRPNVATFVSQIQ